MVEFGKTLLSEQKPEYKGYYIDYQGLKLKIRHIVESLSAGVDLPTVDEQIKDFLTYIDHQINKSATFYDELVEDIVHHLSAIRRKWNYLSPETLPFVYNQAKSTSKLIGDCLKFLELNAEGTRKILKKAEKLIKHEALCKDEILIDMLRPDKMDSKLTKLRLHQGMHKIIDEVKDRINLMRALELEWLKTGMVDKRFSRGLHKRQDTQDLVDSMYSTATKTLASTRWYYGLLNQAHIDYEAEPVGTATPLGIFINNLNTFLYMVNYYIIIPTASEYSSSVGMSALSSGYLLAMTPLSSLFSSVIYSIWSNRSFRVPLIFCSIVLCFGNLFYAIAFYYKSPFLLFLGRITVGLGGNRAINRRYIADFIPIESRTFHSALFVAVGAFGMSVGPALSPLLGLLDFKLPLLNYQVNGLTGPGWLLFILWVMFSFQVILMFKEPERKYAITTQHIPIQPLIENEEKNANSNVWRKFFLKFNKRDPEMNTIGISLCLWIYFVLKLTQESLQSSAPLVTNHWFGWTDYYVAYLLGAIGLIILPSNLIVGWLGHKISDRIAQIILIIGIICGCVIILIFNSKDYTVYQYITGFTAIFLSCQILEGINMGLLSKIMPKSLSKGLLNSGFLSTEAGTLGRAIGSIIVSLAGLNGIVTLQNLLVLPSIILHMLTIALIMYLWKQIVPAVDFLTAKKHNHADELLRASVWLKDTKLFPIIDTLSSQNLQQKRGSILLQDSSIDEDLGIDKAQYLLNENESSVLYKSTGLPETTSTSRLSDKTSPFSSQPTRPEASGTYNLNGNDLLDYNFTLLKDHDSTFGSHTRINFN